LAINYWRENPKLRALWGCTALLLLAGCIVLVIFLGKERKLLQTSPQCDARQQTMAIACIVLNAITFFFLVSFGVFSYSSRDDTLRTVRDANTGQVVSSSTYSRSQMAAGSLMVACCAPAILSGLYCYVK